MKRLFPGLAIVVLVTAMAFAVSRVAPVVSALLVAVLAGIALRTAGLIPRAAEPGLAFAGRTVLRAGVVLLGFQLSLPVVAELGWGAIVVILATVALTFGGTLLLGRALGIAPTRRILVATGTAICGAAAVAAMAAVVDRPGVREWAGAGAGTDAGTDAGEGAGDATGDGIDDEVEEAAATAVAGVTLFGTLALALLPVLARALELSPLAAGVWIGSGIHEVGQVVAAGGLLGPDELAHAVVTKLGRVLLLAPMVLAVGVALARRAGAGAGAVARAPAAGGAAPVSDRAKRPPLVPAFVAGFVALVVVRSVVGLPDAHVVPATVKVVSTLALTAAMVAMGAGVRLRSLLSTGGPMLLLSGAASLLAGTVSLVGVLVLV